MSEIIAGDPVSTPVEQKSPEVKTQESKAFYKGLGGEIETPEQLANYTKNLEDMFVAQKAQQMKEVVVAPPVAQPFAQPINREEELEKQIDEVWFSDSKKARALMDERYELKEKQKLAKLEEVKVFWNNFYSKNPDLKQHESAVQLILTAKNAEVQKFQTMDETEKFLSGETRKIIDPIKNQYGTKEVPLESKAAISFGASGDPVRTPPMPDASRPLTLTDQVLQLNRKRRQKK